MRTKLLITLCSLITVSCIHSQVQENETVMGKVRSVKINVYDASIDSGKVIQGEHGTRFTDRVDLTFDQKGRQISRLYYRANGSIYLSYFKHYNSLGLVDSSWSLIEDQAKSGNWDTYSYNKKKQLVIYSSYYNGSEKITIEKAYNEKGWLILSDYYYWGKLDTKTAFRYNSKGWLLEKKILYVGQNNGINTYQYEYDKKGNKTNEKLWDSNGDLAHNTNYDYDKKGRLKAEVTYNGKGDFSNKYEYEYDRYGNVTDQMEYRDNYETIRHHTMQYEYDKKHNWTKKVLFYNNEPVEIVIREITY